MESERQLGRLGAASGLHWGPGMMVRIVGLLAVLSLAGCGVGADESYADLEAGNAEQGLDQAPASEQAVPTTQPTETTTLPPAKNPSAVGLPQDPIPVFVGKPPVPTEQGLTMDPGMVVPLPLVAPPALPPGVNPLTL